ncbi:glycosyltransferase [Halodurantibacterium flavum]|uniref:Glycosyltransferase n=1 Tax=Halodurantibacterium flavum TaxID=1382802 RepID=A0ABW4S6V0_9RHOB
MGRLGQNLIAQGYAQAVTIAVQLATAPVLIAVWGAERFGLWLLVMVLPSMMAFGDLGYTFVTKNEMTMRVGRGARRRALVLYQSVLALLSVLGASLLAVLLPLLWLVGGETGGALALLAVSGVLWPFFLLMAAALRAEGYAAEEAAAAATARLAEAAGIVLAALAGGGFLAAAGTVLALRIASVGLFALHLRRRVPWLRQGWRLARRAELRAITPAALGYVTVPLGQAALLQGPVLILGSLAGPVAVAGFAVLRTVLRLGTAGSNMLTHAFTPEYSRAAGRGEGAGFRGLWRLQAGLVLTGGVVFLALLPGAVPWAFGMLARGELRFDPWMGAALAAGVLAEMVWTTALAPLAAVNRHRGAGVILCALAAAGLALGAALVPVAGAGGMAVALAVAQAGMAGVVLRALGRFLRDVPRAQRPKRVVFLGLATYSGTGGLQRFNQRLLAALMRDAAARGWQMRAILRGDRPSDLPADNAAIRVWGRAGMLLALAHALRADVVLLGHINLLPLAWLARRLRGRGQRLILFAHGIEVWGDPRHRTPRRAEGRMLRACDRIAAVSLYTARRMARVYAIPAGRFTIFPNTVDPVPPPVAVPRAGLLTVTRLGAHDADKHVDAVLRALVHLPQERLTVVGDGPLRPGLEALAADLGVGARVRFAGRVDDAELAALYASAAVFVLPSAKEGFGIVYLEAWAHGLPVICGTGGAGPEVVRDGVDGFAVPPDDPGRLAERIALLRDDPALAARMVAAGQARIRADFSPANLDRNLRALLEVS